MSSSESLFEHGRKVQAERDAPLADRMRPRTFDEFVGQELIVDPDRVLLKSIAAGRLPSIILWGPPGTGKTTLARLVASSTQSDFQ
ncbi:MAG: AAA family ATPase, partial [Chloroflexi bacterium]|nr:AAA family ATPase [Chloroflexota bacterium]